MLTFEQVLAAFKGYLDEDSRYEILWTSHGYVILEWSSSNQSLESAIYCPTPEVMKEALLDDFVGFLEYKTTLGNRDLKESERQAIEARVEDMDEAIQ